MELLKACSKLLITILLSKPNILAEKYKTNKKKIKIIKLELILPVSFFLFIEGIKCRTIFCSN